MKKKNNTHTVLQTPESMNHFYNGANKHSQNEKNHQQEKYWET